MRTIIKGDMLMLVPESGSEAVALARWRKDRHGHVLALLDNAGRGATIQFLGLREEVCREPINVTSKHPDPKIRLIGNLAATPFDLDGMRFASVESFWQSLKFSEHDERARVAGLDGLSARKAGACVAHDSLVTHQGSSITVGSAGHWELMERACRAKFEQNAEAKDALLSTRDRPLTYRVNNPCRLIPGAILADIWMRIRCEHLAVPGDSTAIQVVAEEDDATI